MNRDEALQALVSESAYIRQQAARSLVDHAEVGDLETVRRAFKKETVYWVRSYLRRVLIRLAAATQTDTSLIPEDRQSVPEYADAVRTVTRELVHELRHYVARLNIYARKIRGSKDSDILAHELARLNGFLDAMLRLADAASPPEFEQFDLVEELYQRTADELRAMEHPISFTGSIPFLVVADRRLVSLIYCNALRNAIEASAAVEEKSAIVVNWGETDVDYWLVIIDTGVGLPAGGAKVFDVGITTKRAHFGMGLSISRQAADSLGGAITLSPTDTGAVFELRWAKGVSYAVTAD